MGAPRGAASDADGTACVCNRCGAVRSDAQFVARVEAYFAEEAEAHATEEALPREAAKLSIS